jgi:hypothetical protein
MAFTTEQCSKRASAYEKIAEQESAPKAVRMLFARKANSLRIIARLTALGEANLQTMKPTPASHSTALQAWQQSSSRSLR